MGKSVEVEGPKQAKIVVSSVPSGRILNAEAGLSYRTPDDSFSESNLRTLLQLNGAGQATWDATCPKRALTSSGGSPKKELDVSVELSES